MKFFKSIFFLLIAFFLQISFSYSQDRSIIYQNLNSEDGLSQNSVFATAKDKYGFMWFGTQDGLNKYDGYKFTVYKHIDRDANSLLANNIYTLCADSEGNIWVGTRVAGLSKFNRETNSFQNYSAGKTAGSLSSNRITSVYEDRKHNIWVGTARGLNLLNKKTQTFTQSFSASKKSGGLENERITTLCEDKTGKFWIGTINGLNLFDRNTGTSVRFVNIPGDANSLSDNHINSILEDDLGNLWIGTGNGLNLMDRNTGRFTRYKITADNNTTLGVNPINFMSQGKGNKIWLGTATVLQLFDTKTKAFIPIKEKDSNGKELNGNGILSLLEDRGILWVGTLSLGINKYDQNLSYFPSYRTGQKDDEAASNLIRCMAEDAKGNLYIGTDLGLQYFNRTANKVTYYQHKANDKNSIASNYTASLLVPRRHPEEVWIGTFESGLDCYYPASGKFKHYTKGKDDYHLNDSIVYALMEDKNGNIWIGTDMGGVNIFNRATGKFTVLRHEAENRNSLADNIAQVFMEDALGNIWIGSFDSGISIYNPVSKKFTHLNTKNSNLSSDVISSFYQDKKGVIWVGTMEGGFNRYDAAPHKFKAYTEQNGLINNVVYFITEDSRGYLWLTTNQGIVRFDPKKETYKNFSTYNGLQSQEFNFGAGLKTKFNEIAAGGIKGINIFNPDELSENKNVPSVYITGFELFNKPVFPGGKDAVLKKSLVETKEIKLNYEQTVITFEFSALDFTRPEKNEYAYRLDNFDKEWVYAGTQHQATYTNLDPGTYYFRVKASNNDGVWNDEGTSIKIIITPPYWLTWWFKLLAVSAAAGCIYAFYRYRINVIHKQKDKLEAEVLIRTAELNSQSEELLSQSNHLRSLNNELLFQQALEKKARKEAEEARQEAESANLAKSTFLATMSHEIRTPMNGVLGMTSILAKTDLSHEQRQYTDIIKVSGENLLHVINDILDFSKIESGNMELDLFDFNLRNYVEEVMDLFVGKAAASAIELVYEIDSEIPIIINGDGNRLRQILINLIGNAAKFTHDGEIYLKISLLSRNDGSLQLHFEVHDTGIGIAKDKLDKLFKSFSQVDSSTTRKYGGSGLGLVICERLVELMGGEIGVKSELGKGSIFSFNIKCNASSESALTVPVIYPHNCEGKTALIVDDNAANLQVLSKQLKAWNLNPVTAANSKEALELLKNNLSFDLVITDLHLPDINGLELSYIIKQNFKSKPLILLSSISDEVDDEYLNLFSSIVYKPVKIAQLSSALQREFSQNVLNNTVYDKLDQLSSNFALTNPVNILIADDDFINQEFMSIILNKLGYKPKMVNNGKEALNALKEENFDVIYMGIQMPEMDGIEACQIIRRENIQQPVIIAITANAIGIDREVCLEAGMNDYITKPIDLAVFLRTLEKAAGN